MENADVRERFVGREAELRQFKQWLTNSEPEAPRILYLYDKLDDPDKKGGVGKTWLLRIFADIARELYPQIVIVSIDFFNITDRDGTVVAERVMQALKAAHPACDISRFESALLRYNEAVRTGAADTTDQRYHIAEALGEDLHALDGQLQEVGKHLLILFDTYELIQENPLTAVLRLDRTFPDDYEFSRLGIVIAGRYALNWQHANWRGRERMVETMPIAPFTPSEIRAYFTRRASVIVSDDPEEIKALHERTDGRPILIGLVSDVLSRPLEMLDGRRLVTLKELISIPERQFKASLIAKIYDPRSRIDQVLSLIIPYMAHIYHRFNFALLEQDEELRGLLQGIDTAELARQLRMLSFVRCPDSGDDFVLHDEMRPMVTSYYWDENDRDEGTRKQLSRCAIRYYERELRRLQEEPAQSIQSEQRRQAYIVELLYHKLYVDLESGYAYFTEHFSWAVELILSSFSRALLHEAQQFRGKMSPAQRYDLKFSEARLWRKEEAAEQVLKLCLELEQEAEQSWLAEYKADLLFEKGVAYQQLSQYPAAIECFTQASDIKKQQDELLYYAGIRNWLGFVYQKQGRLDTALSYYEECLKIRQGFDDKQACAAVLVSISDIYRLQGNVEKALREAKTSWHIRRNLLTQGRISEVFVGWSRVTIGLAHYQNNDFLEAGEAFQEALEIFTRPGHRRGLATVYNCLGKLSMDQGAFYHARQWFEDAYTMALGIDLEQQINSLNNQGRLLTLEKQYRRAIERFQQAMTLAEDAHNDYQQAEALVYLAGAFKHVGDDEQSQQARREASEICQKYRYYYLLGLPSTIEGDALYDAHNYKEAFRNYGEACYALARYNNREYQKGLRKMGDAFYNVPPEEINPIADALIAYWSAQGLETDYPDFVSTCQEMKSLLGE